MTYWTRRHFLTSAAGGAAISLARWPRAWAADDAAPGKYILGLQSYSLRNFPVDKAIAQTQELGLHAIEFFSGHFPLDSSAEQIAAMKTKFTKFGLQALGHGVNGFTKDHAANRRVFEFAKRAGVRNISADPTEDSFDSLDRLVDEYDVRIAIHNHGPGARYDKINDVLDAIKGHDKRIGACADLGHYIRSGEDPVKAIHLFEGRLYGVHLKDFDEPKDKARGVILGKGQLDVVGVFRALNKVKFPADGSLSIEYEEKPDDPLDDLRQCVAISREAMKKAADTR